MFHWTIHLEGEHRKLQSAVVVGHEIYCFRRVIQDDIDVNIFNTVSLCWRRLTPETPGIEESHFESHIVEPDYLYIENHTAVLIGDNVYLWGGWTHLYDDGYIVDMFNVVHTVEYDNVLHAFDVDVHTWFKPQASGTVPKGRIRHSACVLGKAMFIYGGWTQDGPTIDIYKLDTTTMVWAFIDARGTPPDYTLHHSSTIIGTKMFVFGSFHWRDNDCCNTMSVFDTETDHWVNALNTTASILPDGHEPHSAFTYNEELYIFGGSCRDSNIHPLWKYNPGTFYWEDIEPKGEGVEHFLLNRMCCCMVGDRVILVGAYNSPRHLYVLDLSPSLKTLCKLAVIQYGLEQSELPHNIRWELTAMTSNVCKYED